MVCQWGGGLLCYIFLYLYLCLKVCVYCFLPKKKPLTRNFFQKKEEFVGRAERDFLPPQNKGKKVERNIRSVLCVCKMFERNVVCMSFLQNPEKFIPSISSLFFPFNTNRFLNLLDVVNNHFPFVLDFVLEFTQLFL